MPQRFVENNPLAGVYSLKAFLLFVSHSWHLLTWGRISLGTSASPPYWLRKEYVPAIRAEPARCYKYIWQAQPRHFCAQIIALCSYARYPRVCKAYSVDIGLLFRLSVMQNAGDSPPFVLCRIAIISIFKYSLQDCVWVSLSLWLITQVVYRVCVRRQLLLLLSLGFSYALCSQMVNGIRIWIETQWGAWCSFQEACMLVTWEFATVAIQLSPNSQELLLKYI